MTTNFLNDIFVQDHAFGLGAFWIQAQPRLQVFAQCMISVAKVERLVHSCQKLSQATSGLPETGYTQASVQASRVQCGSCGLCVATQVQVSQFDSTTQQADGLYILLLLAIPFVLIVLDIFCCQCCWLLLRSNPATSLKQQARIHNSCVLYNFGRLSYMICIVVLGCLTAHRLPSIAVSWLCERLGYTHITCDRHGDCITATLCILYM